MIWPWRRVSRRERHAQHEDEVSTGPPRWVELGAYAGHFDADVDRVLLETAGIPVLVKGASTGIFGPGFAGPTAEGVRLFVPASRLAYAREVLAGDEDGER
jgi:hypothetical protein